MSVNDGYYPDLEHYSLSSYKELLVSMRLPPSQQLLLEGIDHNFEILTKQGIINLAELQTALKSKSHVVQFAEKTGITEKYLVILRREVNSLQPKPIKLSEFPTVKQEVVEQLLELGIKDTRDLFSKVKTKQSRADLSSQNAIDPSVLLLLTKLSDLSRLKWVGPKFALLLTKTKYDTVESVQNSTYSELFDAVMEANEVHQIYRGSLGREDLRSWVEVVVQDVPLEIEY